MHHYDIKPYRLQDQHGDVMYQHKLELDTLQAQHNHVIYHYDMQCHTVM